MFFNNSFYIASNGRPINFFFGTSFFFSFSSDFFTYQLDFSLFWPFIFCNLLDNLFQSFSLFLVLFWMLRMLVTVNKPCHVPHLSWIITWGTNYRKIFLGVSKEWTRSWSYVSLITNFKKLPKKLLTVRPENWMRRKKRKKSIMAIAKLFALKANAVNWSVSFLERAKDILRYVLYKMT